MTEHTTHQRIALVTGANKGIGRAAAEQLAARGITVLIGARDPLRGKEAAAALRATGGDAHPATLDVTDAATARAAAEQVEERFGHLDVLINNAGGPRPLSHASWPWTASPAPTTSGGCSPAPASSWAASPRSPRPAPS